MLKMEELMSKRGNVPLRYARGHFATNHSHINYYIDISIKNNLIDLFLNIWIIPPYYIVWNINKKFPIVLPKESSIIIYIKSLGNL